MGGRDFEVNKINNIVDFMKLCKGDANDEFSNKRRQDTDNSNRSRGDKNQGGGGNGRIGFNQGGGQNICRFHGGHDWKICLLNCANPNYRGNRNNNRFNMGDRGQERAFDNNCSYNHNNENSHGRGNDRG